MLLLRRSHQHKARPITRILIGRTHRLLREPQSVDWGVLALGTVVAGLSAYACIHYFIRLLSRTGMLPYVLYRIALGLLLFWLFW